MGESLPDFCVMYDAVMIGGGIAGMTAAIYLQRALRKVIVLEKEEFGGQINASPRVDNYPGFTKVSGMDLSEQIYRQMESFGIENEYAEVEAVRKDSEGFVIERAGAERLRARSIIVATGAVARKLGVPGEEELIGKGVSFCATCDGAFFRDKVVTVVGGGEVALGDALYLANLCKKVIIIHRRDRFRGAKWLEKELAERQNVEFLMEATVRRVLGNETVRGVRVRCGEKEHTVQCDGVFVCVGREPETAFLGDLVKRDGGGYIEVDTSLMTSCAGVFAAGDVRVTALRQLTMAAADGSLAATKVNKYLEKL